MNHNQSSLLDKYKQALLSAGQYDALRVLEHAHLLPDTVSAQAHRGPAQGRPATAVEDPSPSATSGSSPKRRKSAPFVACTLCRRCKAKCIKSDPSSSQCDRCRETGCVCIYERHRRGRKRVRGLDLPRIEDGIGPAGDPSSLENGDSGQSSSHPRIRASSSPSRHAGNDHGRGHGQGHGNGNGNGDRTGSTSSNVSKHNSGNDPAEPHNQAHAQRATSPVTRLVVTLDPDLESEDEGDGYEADYPSAGTGSVDQSQYAANPLPFIQGSNRPFSLRNLLNPTASHPPSQTVLHVNNVIPSAVSHPPHNPSISTGPRLGIGVGVGVGAGLVGTEHGGRAVGQVGDGRPGAGASGLGRGRADTGDLVTRGVLSLDMAHQLFSFFMHSLNPIIMLFDPELHTFDYIRAKSRFLFSTILAASAKFIAPSISGVLAQDVGECSIQAILGSRRSVETVQAWMMIYFWKAPRDNRAWTYVGLLCRLAVEIGLDRIAMEDAPGSSELQQRERRNRIRTWMLAYMMDRALASTTGRDWCLRGRDPIIQNPRQFSDHPLRNHGDAVIAGFAELRRLASEAIDTLSSRRLAKQGDREQDVARQLLIVNYDLDEWRQFWQTEMLRHQSPERYWAYLRFFELHIRLTLNSFGVNAQQLLNPVIAMTDTRSTASAEQYCYAIATENLLQLQAIRDLDVGILHHAQDSISIMVAYAACFLRVLVNSPNLSQLQRDQAFELIDQTSQMFKTVGENRETTATLQAEFLQSLAAHHRSLAGVHDTGQIATDPFFLHGTATEPAHYRPGGAANGMATGIPNGIAPGGGIGTGSANLGRNLLETGLVGMGSNGESMMGNPQMNTNTTTNTNTNTIDITDFDAWLSAFELDGPSNPDLEAGRQTHVDNDPMSFAPMSTAPAPLLPPDLGGADLSNLSNTDWDAILSTWLNPMSGGSGQAMA